MLVVFVVFTACLILISLAIKSVKETETNLFEANGKEGKKKILKMFFFRVSLKRNLFLIFMICYNVYYGNILCTNCNYYITFLRFSVSYLILAVF